MHSIIKYLILAAVTGSLMLPVVQADPPPWAPAHGYRNKNKNKNKVRDYDDHIYSAERFDYYGILDGRCNREEIGTVLGGAVGGVIGGNTASDRTVGTIAGVIVGAVVGNVIGRAMDDADRYCTGHVLEYAEDNSTITWNTQENGSQYRVTPVRTYNENSLYCRDFIVTRETSRGAVDDRQKACRNPDGTWQML
jgi:surface antigen